MTHRRQREVLRPGCRGHWAPVSMIPLPSQAQKKWRIDLPSPAQTDGISGRSRLKCRKDPNSLTNKTIEWFCLRCQMSSGWATRGITDRVRGVTAGATGVAEKWEYSRGYFGVGGVEQPGAAVHPTAEVASLQHGAPCGARAGLSYLCASRALRFAPRFHIGNNLFWRWMSDSCRGESATVHADPR